MSVKQTWHSYTQPRSHSQSSAVPSSARSLATDNGVVPGGLVHAGAVADVVVVAVRVAPTVGEAVRVAREALGHAIDVASQSLLQRVQVCSLTSADCRSGISLFLWVLQLNLKERWHTLVLRHGIGEKLGSGVTYLGSLIDVAFLAGDLPRAGTVAGDVAAGDVPRYIGLDSEEEGGKDGKRESLHVERS